MDQEADADKVAELHNDVRAFITSTLSLPEVDSVLGTGTHGITEASLQRFEVAPPDSAAAGREPVSTAEPPTDSNDTDGGPPTQSR